MEWNESEIRNTLATVFGVQADTINEDTSVDSVPTWDSLRHMNLVLALEEKFNITFTEEQTVEILNYALIKAILAEHGVTFAG